MSLFLRAHVEGSVVLASVFMAAWVWGLRWLGLVCDGPFAVFMVLAVSTGVASYVYWTMYELRLRDLIVLIFCLYCASIGLLCFQPSVLLLRPWLIYPYHG